MEHPISQRIKIILERETNGKVVEFASRMNGIPYQVVSRLFKIDPRTQKYPTPTTDLIIEIIRTFTSYNISWIMTGEGEMLREEKNENLFAAESGIKYESKNDYWKGRYDQIKEDYEKLLKELGKVLK